MKIGITGHQRLDDETAWKWVEEAMRAEIEASVPPVTAISSLAIGADQLFSNAVLASGGDVYAVLPYKDIERSFAPEDLPAFQRVLQASKVEVMKTEGTDQDAYLAAGKRVVDLADSLIAVWNGAPAKGKGGTGDIVSYAKDVGLRVRVIDPVKRNVFTA